MANNSKVTTNGRGNMFMWIGGAFSICCLTAAFWLWRDASARETATNVQASFREEVINRLKGYAAERLTDPDSVKFRKLVLYHDPSQLPGAPQAGEYRLCGELNAKNRMGGYVGYRLFMSETFIKSDTLQSAKEASGAFIEENSLDNFQTNCKGLGEPIGQ